MTKVTEINMTIKDGIATPTYILEDGRKITQKCEPDGSAHGLMPVLRVLEDDPTPNVVGPTALIINEAHTLMPEQEKIMKDRFGEWDTILVPNGGWKKEKRDEVCKTLPRTVVFASPIAGMVKTLTNAACQNNAIDQSGLSGVICETKEVLVFANDNRRKMEVGDGKIVSVIEKTGWYLE